MQIMQLKKKLPARCHGSRLKTSISGMTRAGRGCENVLRDKYWNTISSSVGSNLNPGGNFLPPSLTKFILSIRDRESVCSVVAMLHGRIYRDGIERLVLHKIQTTGFFLAK